MKVLGIVCSPRKRGNTEILVAEALAGAKDLNAEVELVTIADKHISPCDGCESCETTMKCRIEDDMQQLYSKLLETDGIVFGTPVYFWNVSAQAKIIIDRTFLFRTGRKLKGKIAGVVVAARRSGASQAFSLFHDFFNIQKIISVSEVAIAYANRKGEVRKDKRGMEGARAVGRVIAETIQVYKSIKG